LIVRELGAMVRMCLENAARRWLAADALRPI
jgi:hypothetical protein